MTQVCQHYAHTFEKFKFHFHYESDPNFPVLGAIITRLGTLMYYDKFSSKQELQVCKQQQTASGNKNL